MIPKIRIDEKTDIHIWATASNHPFYKSNVGLLSDLLYESLATRGPSQGYLGLQMRLLGYILKVDQVIKRYRRYHRMVRRALAGLAKNNATVERLSIAQQRLEDMEDYTTAARWVADRLRSIGDGMAWRFLDYDRVALRLLAEHAPVSIPQPDSGLVAEIGELWRRAIEIKQPVLLNTITNFLRIGDLTIRDAETGTVEIVEVKSGSKANSRVVRQAHIMKSVQKGLDSGVYAVGDHKLHKVTARRPLQTYVRSVENAMRDAEIRFAATRLFGDYLSVAIYAVDKITEFVPEEEWSHIWNTTLDRLYEVRKNSTDVLLPVVHSNFVIAHFVPNMAPYVVFPIEPRLRFALLTGQIWVGSLLNVSGLGRWLERRGWKVEILPSIIEMPDSESLPYLAALRAFNKEGVGAEVGSDTLMGAAAEFRMPESIELELMAGIDTVEEWRADGERLYQVVFPNRGKNAWD